MEKTFEELIEENKRVEYSNEDPYYNTNYIVDVDDVLKLLQQVREATKEECRDIASEFSLHETLKHIDNLPTDRIKINL